MRKKSLLNLLSIIFIPIILLSFVYAIRASVSDDRIKDILKSSEPIFLWANIFFIAIGIWASRKVIISHLVSISASSWKKIVIIFVLAFILRAFVAPHTHRLYYDEDIYLNIAQNMVYDGRAVATNFGVFYWDNFKSYDDFLNKQPNAYPALVSLFFMLFGIEESVASILTIVLSSLTVILLFLFTCLLLSDRLALWASLFYSLIPVAIVWAPTTSTEPPMVFFMILSMYLFALFVREKDRNFRVAFSAFMSLAFTIQFRPEGVFFLPVVFLFVLSFDRKFSENLSDVRMTLIWLVFSLILAHHTLHVLCFMNEDWGAVDKDRFGLKYLGKNTGDNLAFFVKNREFPLIFTICAVLGLLGYMGKWREKLLLIVWIVLFFMPYLFFYAGSYCYGVDVRFSLMMLCPLSILCGLGMDRIKQMLDGLFPARPTGHILVIILVLFFLPHLKYIRDVHEESWDARLDHDLLTREANKLPRDAIIFSHSPYVVVLVAKRGAIQSYFGADDEMVSQVFRITDNVYFYREYWCYAPATKINYDFFRERFDMEPVASDELFERDYTLYKIKRK